MSSLEEKIKEMEPAQIGIYALIGVVGIFLIYSLFSGSGEEEEEKTEFAMPENRNKVKDYNNKLDAYSRSNEEQENQVSLEFDINDFSTDEKVDRDQEKLDREVDSMLNQNKIQYSQKNKKNTSHTSSSKNGTTKSYKKKSNTNRVSNTQQKKSEDIDKSFDDFFSSNPENDDPNEDLSSYTDPLIYAVIHGNQTIEQSQRVKLRLTKDALIKGIKYEKNSYIYAKTTFSTNRVLLDITVINHKPVNISAWDGEDGDLGAYVEGAKIVGEISKEGQKDAIDDVDVAGVPVGSAIKKVFQKKQQVQSITLLNNARLILKPNK